MKKVALWTAGFALATGQALAQVEPAPAPPVAPTEEKIDTSARESRIAKLQAELDELRTKQEAIRKELQDLGAGQGRPRVERLQRTERDGAEFRHLPEDFRRQLEEMQARMRDMEHQFRDSDMTDFGPTTDLKADHQSAKTSMSMTHGPDGVTVTITEDQDGKEVTKSYSAPTHEELLNKYPELKERGLLGGGLRSRSSLRFEGGTLSPRWQILPELPTAPTPLVPSPLTPMPGQDQHRLGVTVDMDLAEAGLRVQSVEPDSLAQALGLQVGDVVIEVCGDEVSQPADVRPALRKVKAGDEVTVKIQREGANQTLTARKPGRGRSL